MIFQGSIENGVVVFGEPVSLPDGTPVRVEAFPGAGVGFWERCSIEELARRQGVRQPESGDEALGGWPEDELEDGFESTLRPWRQSEMEHGS